MSEQMIKTTAEAIESPVVVSKEPWVVNVPHGELNIATNGLYNVAQYETANVDVQPTGNIDITENGEYNVADYATATVETPQPTGEIEITTNGTVDVSQYATAKVDVGTSVTVITQEQGAELGYTPEQVEWINANAPGTELAANPITEEDMEEARRWTCTTGTWRRDGVVATNDELRNVRILPPSTNFTDMRQGWSLVLLPKTTITYSGAGWYIAYKYELQLLDAVIPGPYVTLTATFCGPLRKAIIRNNSTGDGFNTMREAFQNNYSLQEIEIQPPAGRLSNTFRECRALTKAKVNITGVTLMDNAFSSCASIADGIELTGDGSSITNLQGAFSSCITLRRLDLSPIPLENVTSYSSMLSSVPTTCEILVRDQASLDWMTAHFPTYTNTHIKS